MEIVAAVPSDSPLRRIDWSKVCFYEDLGLATNYIVDQGGSLTGLVIDEQLLFDNQAVDFIMISLLHRIRAEQRVPIAILTRNKDFERSAWYPFVREIDAVMLVQDEHFPSYAPFELPVMLTAQI